MMDFLEVHHLILMICPVISLQNSMTDVLKVQRIFAYNKKRNPESSRLRKFRLHLTYMIDMFNLTLI